MNQQNQQLYNLKVTLIKLRVIFCQITYPQPLEQIANIMQSSKTIKVHSVYFTCDTNFGSMFESPRARKRPD